MFKESSVKLKCSMVAQRESTRSQRGFLLRRFSVSLGLFGLVVVGLSLALGTARAATRQAAHQVKLSASRYARLPLSFEANRGQTDSRVKFLARGQNYTLFLTEHDAVLALRSGKAGQAPTSTVVRLRLLNSASAVRVSGQSLLRGTSNYFLGNNPRNWHTNIPSYAQVRYQQVYPGIDVVYHGSQGKLENDFILSPGSNPDSIRIALEGVNSLRIDRSGDLVLKTGEGKVYLRRPRAYQGSNDVPVHYVLKASNQVGLELGRYDHQRQLVIDPVLAYSTYFGGGGGDIGYGIAVDSSGDAYITGISNSTNFPTTSGSQSGTYGGNGDVFVAKIDPTGTTTTPTTTPQLVYSTYLGGSGTDSGNAITVDASGDAFITGSTNSANFPTTSGVFQTTNGGAGDAFVAQINSTGNALVYSSYLGGTGADAGMGIAVDSSGNAYITGSTQSPNFPTVGPAQALNAGSSDAFISKVDFTGANLLYSTYLGGSSADVADSIKVDGSGNAFVAGYTFSSDFQIASPVQGSNAGTVNAFVTELNAAGSAFSFSTYLGGSGDDRAFGLALDSSGNVYVAGGAQSTNFPTTTGVLQGTNNGQSDAFVTKINPSGPTIVYSTLLGGTGIDQANGIAVDSSNNVFVTGFTNSSGFPTYTPIQSILGITGGSSCGTSACSDAFVSELNSGATALLQSTYLGGSGADFGQAIALGPNGRPFVTGTTSSSNFPAIAGAYQSSLNGVAGNAFVAVIDPTDAPGISIVPQTVDFGNQTQYVRSSVRTVTVTNEGTSPLNITGITFTETDTSGNTDFAESDNCIGTVAASGGTCNINITFTPNSLTPETGRFDIADNASGSPHSINVSGNGVTSATAVTVTPTSLSFGNITVGQTSSAQTVTITNTGTTTLKISSITTSGDFAQTNTCSALLNDLNVGQSCNVSVTFTPTASGSRGGALSINDNAAGSPQSVALAGTGDAQFTMSSSSPNVTTLIGNGSATFTVAASSSSSFSGSITLSCPANLTCSFNPASIFAGQTSTLTVSNITSSMANPYAFSVIGTSGSQSATVDLKLLFQDYTLTASPALNTIVAGSAATYTLTLTPVNGFNNQVQLACGNGMPPGASCTFSNSSVTPSGGPATISLTIQTTKNSSVPPPIIPPGMVPPLMVVLLVLVLGALLVLKRSRYRFPRLAGRRWVQVQVGMLCLVILCELFLGSCRSTPTATGSTTGNYIITVNGTLGSNSSVVRSTNIDLSVT